MCTAECGRGLVGRAGLLGWWASPWQLSLRAWQLLLFVILSNLRPVTTIPTACLIKERLCGFGSSPIALPGDAPQRVGQGRAFDGVVEGSTLVWLVAIAGRRLGLWEPNGVLCSGGALLSDQGLPTPLRCELLG